MTKRKIHPYAWSLDDLAGAAREIAAIASRFSITANAAPRDGQWIADDHGPADETSREPIRQPARWRSGHGEASNPRSMTASSSGEA
jgi:hypothetical protein